MSRKTDTPRTCRAIIAPGLEEVLRLELEGLGLSGHVEPGAVVFKATAVELYRVHRLSRVAGRVTVLLGRVGAENLNMLADRVRKLPWRNYVRPRQPLDVKVSTRDSRLRHSSTVSRKVALAIGDALKGPRVPGKPTHITQRVVVHIERDMAHISIDASGELLHRRGYRQQTAKAPLRENLAAAILQLADWQPDEALVDPMCGSGTFPIEAAMMATGRAPGARRKFAFEQWPTFDAAAYKRVQRESLATVDRPRIVGADRNEGAVKASLGNARRARVDGVLQIRHSELADLEPPASRGLLIMNPPYGFRVGGGGIPRKLFRHIGRVLREQWPDWRVAMLVPEDDLLLQMKLDLDIRAHFSNGGIRVGVAVGHVQ